MVKFFLLPLALALFSFAKPVSLSKSWHRDDINYRDRLITEVNERGNYTVTGIADGYLNSNDIRIYQFDNSLIDEIADSAFIGTSFSTIVISKDITHISNAVFDTATNIKSIQFTGSKQEFESLNLSFDSNGLLR